LQIQLSWIDPNTNVRQQPCLHLPVAIGRDFAKMPPTLRDNRVSRMNRVSRIAIDCPEIEEFHAVIIWKNKKVTIVSRRSTKNLAVNGVWCAESPLTIGDKIFITPVEIEVKSIARGQPPKPPNLAQETKDRSVEETSGCDKIVGLLFPRRCGRKSSRNCPHCQGGTTNNNPYFLNSEQSLYSDYGNYRPGDWSAEYYQGTVTTMDFTDADAVSFETHGTDFEQDMGAS
jgi:hypothetical protein